MLFVASLPQVGYFVEGKPYDSGGLLVLGGWAGLLYGIYAWLANPLLLAAWIGMAFHPRLFAFVFASLSLAFALSFLTVTVQPAFSGVSREITGCGLGYWLWVASIGALLVGSGIAAMLEKLADRAANLETAEDWRSEESFVDLTSRPRE
jgi:hypothetical protein